MSQLNDFLDTCFAQCVGPIIPTSDFRIGLNSRPCVIGPMQMTKALRSSGLWEQVTTTAVFTRADFDALQLADRVIGFVGTEQLKVMLIENDPTDPTVTVHLQKAH